MLPEVADIVVVGGGGAGLAAGIEARAAGCDVVLVEKNPELGGSTAWSIGSITATGTPHQLRRGIEDTPAEHDADMPAFAGELDGRDNPALRRVLCEHVPETFAGCWHSASASTARCRSRRTASPACTTCCRTRGATSTTSSATPAGSGSASIAAPGRAGCCSRTAAWSESPA